MANATPSPDNDGLRDDTFSSASVSGIMSFSRRSSAPLFDPHGLSASLYEDQQTTEAAEDSAQVKEVDGHTQDTHAVQRGRRRRSSEKPNEDGAADEEHIKESNATQEASGDVQELIQDRDEEPKKPPRLWWQREEEDDSQDAGPFSKSPVEAQRPSIETQTLPSTSRARDLSSGTGSASRSSSIVSPAAAFLSSMNDMLASPQSSSFISHDGGDAWGFAHRSHSLSPTRADGSSRHEDMTGTDLQSTGSGSSAEAHFGMASAAAQLYNGKRDGSDAQGASLRQQRSRILRPDEQGARFGPKRRYLLGRVIGSGGFSTIREAWDLGEHCADDLEEDHLTESTPWHRLAVKIVYTKKEPRNDQETGENDDDEDGTNELELWKAIPAHPNILPLLYHERLEIEEPASNPVRAPSPALSTIDFLVMPFCQVNLLTYVRSSGSLSPEDRSQSALSQSSSVSGARLTRATSMRNENRPIAAAEVLNPLERSQRHIVGRTGSGFVAHARGATFAGDRIVSAPLSAFVGTAPSSATSPTSAGTSLLRGSSIRARAAQQASRGVAIQSACDIMRQLTEAILCLHHKAGVLHGDIKLENVLGQQWQAEKTPTHTNDSPPGEGGHDKASSPTSEAQSLIESQEEETSHKPSSADADVSATLTICWRLADFGLARKIPSRVDQSDQMKSYHPLPTLASTGRRGDMHNGPLSKHGPSTAPSSQQRLQGGSLAYAAPEVFLVPEAGDSSEESPYATDMWALGCIMYALFAGKLPFMDAFEPRLQSKISQGRWDMPERLKRRGRSKPNLAQTMMDRAGSFGSFQAGFNSTTGSPNVKGARFLSGAPDLSHSLPSLPPRSYSISGIPSSSSGQSVVFAADETAQMGSALGDDNDDEEDSASDAEDAGVDRDMDGLSRERCAVRQILRGLLEPDSSKRWTIRQLAASDWISGKLDDRQNNVDGDEFNTSRKTFNGRPIVEDVLSTVDKPSVDADLPASLVSELNTHAHSERLPTQSLEGDALGFDKDGDSANARSRDEESQSDYLSAGFGDDERGRGRRREKLADIEESGVRRAAKPIDIDRSKSRSRSRVRDEDAPMWGMESPYGGGYSRRQHQQQHSEQATHRHEMSHSRPTSSARSSSVDVSSRRGRAMGAGNNISGAGESGRREKGSRSTSRSRRSELDSIMPQLALHRQGTTGASGHDGDGRPHTATSFEGRESVTSLAPASADENAVSRSSIWKSPLRARDRLANLVGGSRGDKSQAGQHSRKRSGAGEQA